MQEVKDLSSLKVGDEVDVVYTCSITDIGDDFVATRAMTNTHGAITMRITKETLPHIRLYKKDTQLKLPIKWQ